MIFLGVLGYIAAISILCWLVFNLAVFALPFLVGLTLGGWAYETGAGWFGAILIGLVSGGASFALGQVLLGTVRPLWARILIALAFVIPAAIAGYHATLGISRLMMPSEIWQIVFSIAGAFAVAVTAYLRITAEIAPAGGARNSQGA